MKLKQVLQRVIVGTAVMSAYGCSGGDTSSDDGTERVTAPQFTGVSSGGRILAARPEDPAPLYETVTLTLSPKESAENGLPSVIEAIQFPGSAPLVQGVLDSAVDGIKPFATHTSQVTVFAPRVPLSGKWVPPRIQGDSEYNGTATDQPIWYVAVQIWICSSTKICGQIYMDAWEDDGDHTEARGWSPAMILYQGDGRVINQIIYPTSLFDDLSGRDDNGYSPQIIGDSSGFAYQWTIDGDRSGGDAGIFTGVSVVLEDIWLEVLQPH